MNLSILGIYNYDNHIFDDMVIPETIDKQTLIDNILLECAELEILYPDADFLKLAIKSWSKKEFGVWEHFLETTKYKYNPIEDISRKEITTTERTVAGNSGETHAGTVNTKVAAYDTDTFENKEQNETKSGNEYISNETERNARKHEITGNSAAYTVQDLIKKEREMIVNVYDRIISDFKNRFCILIY